MAEEFAGQQNVIAVTFAEDSKAYDALTAIKELDSQGQIELIGGAVVSRGEDGRVDAKDTIGDDDGYTGTATGGVIGLLIGILGGPLGILIGGATGLLIGSLFDVEDDDDTRSVLTDLSRTIQVGRDAVLAEVVEQSVEVIDTAMSRLNGEVLRRSVADVEAEIAAAEDAQRAAKKAARQHLHQQRKAQFKERIHERIEALKAKLHRHHATAASGGSA
jgi:uncharacterized membrane protein